MVALRSLDYEPQPVPHGRNANLEAETVREERRRDHEAMCHELELDDRDWANGPTGPWDDRLGREW